MFSTFSTEFSTVLEAFRYTCCILPGGCWKLLGRNGGIFSFFQKKVEGKNLFFEAFRTGVFSASPIWNFEAAVFHMEEKQKRHVEKRGKTPVFTKKRSFDETHRSFFLRITSYS